MGTSYPIQLHSIWLFANNAIDGQTSLLMAVSPPCRTADFPTLKSSIYCKNMGRIRSSTICGLMDITDIALRLVRAGKLHSGNPVLILKVLFCSIFRAFYYRWRNDLCRPALSDCDRIYQQARRHGQKGAHPCSFVHICHLLEKRS